MMVNIKNVFKNVAFCLFITILVQMMFTISFTQQKALSFNALGQNNHANRLSNEFEQQEGRVGKPSKLALSPELLYLLMKRFEHNEKLQEYLKVLKSKKNDETSFVEEDEDDGYEGKFRF